MKITHLHKTQQKHLTHRMIPRHQLFHPQPPVVQAFGSACSGHAASQPKHASKRHPASPSHNAAMVYKSLHGFALDYLRSKFERRETAYNLRDSENKLNVLLPCTNYYKNSVSYSGATLWNNLPCDIRQAGSLGLFKRLIKKVR